MPKKSGGASDNGVARKAGQSTGASSRTGRKYTAAWQFRTNQNGVYWPDATLNRPQPPPIDREYILERVHRRRPSTSPTRAGAEEEFCSVKRALLQASNESATRKIIEPRLLGDGFGRGGDGNFDGDINDGANVYHDNYAPLIPAEPCYPQPDVYDGAEPTSIVKVVHDALEKVIRPPSSQPQAPIAPNFHFVLKGPAGDAAEATRKVCNGCAYGARGIHALLSVVPPTGRSTRSGRAGGSGLCTIGGSDEAYGKALSFGAMYAYGMLRLYTMHVALYPEEHAYAAATEKTPRPLREYHHVQLDGLDIFSSLAAYCTGKRVIRNLREIARDVRNEVIASVNQRFRNAPSTCHIEFEVSQQGNKSEPSRNSCAPAQSMGGSKASSRKRARGNTAKSSRSAKRGKSQKGVRSSSRLRK